ncbi:MAG: HAD family phosphatase [Thermosipho sp. (in: Bacteria)]|nr:HAD family phosphatase [Thermosipho sp. (in: thermotogales)]MCD6105338.1 HAD family phosphatase [Thermosipho sp. (in: thermotogales)]
MIKNIVFDLGRVLLNWDPYSYMIKHFEKEVAEFLKKHVFETEDWQMMDKGEITEEELWQDKLDKYPDYKDYILHMKNKVLDLLVPIEQNVSLIPLLKEKGYKLFVLSNFSKNTFQKVFEKYDFFKYFDGMVISSHVREIKPYEKIYQILIKKYKVKPGESLYIDDKIENIETGKKLGFKTIHLEMPLKLEEKLKKYIEV